ncbi:MAG: hypothetical protein HY904_00200 [Deltaproteobacteria bacterium]|nr:hypothetical protein [Deltaproteobacteria bacterium]
MRASSYFSMQVACPTFDGDPLLGSLRTLVERATRAARMPEKRQVYAGIADVLLQNLERVEYGIWDYWNEPGKVAAGYQDWVDGLEGKEAPREAAPPGAPAYTLFTTALLMKKGSNTDTRMQAVCNVSDGKLWRRKTFRRILSDGVRNLNFAFVRDEVIYLYPNDPAFAVTEGHLLNSGHFPYLRKVEDD